MTLPVHLHSLPCITLRPFDFSSLPCGKLNSSSGWDIPRCASRNTNYSQFVPAHACRSASVHTPVMRAVVRTQYIVMLFPSAPFSRNRLSLSSIVANVYRDALLARHWIGFELL